MNTITVWTSLEIVKLIVSFLSPLVLIILGYLINRRLKRTEFQHWTNQKVIEKRLAIFDEIAPLLNALYCYFTYVGRWKELTPPDVIDLKRDLDRLAHIYAPIFTSRFVDHYAQFMDCCYLTYQGWGENAKLRTEYARRKEAAGKSWQQGWSSMFAKKIADHREIEINYQDLMSFLSRSLGIGLGGDSSETTKTPMADYSKLNSSTHLVGDEDFKLVEKHTYRQIHKERRAAELSKSDLKGLENLQKRIEHSSIPERSPGKTLNIAAWNIREFGKRRRSKLSLYLIAEIIKQFDLIAISEVRGNLTELERVKHILGPSWKFLYSDLVADYSGGKERVCYLYDEGTVVFNGLAAEAETPRKKHIDGKYIQQFSWWRKPYIASFSTGDFGFVLMTAYLHWGEYAESQEGTLKLLAKWIDARRKDQFAVEKDIILIGNFNIPKADNNLFKVITSKGLKIPTELRGVNHGSNLAKNKRYDQILHYSDNAKSFIGHAGVLDFYTGGMKKLFPESKLTLNEFTFQLSDHLPVWIQININCRKEN